ncbi:hypothetical protein [Spirosoma areae]
MSGCWLNFFGTLNLFLMNRTAAYLIGPELVWILMLALVGIIIALNQPLTRLDHWGLTFFLYTCLPAIGVMLAFVPLFWAPGSQWGWLARIGFSSLIGVVLLVGYLSKSVSFQDIRDIGVGMGFLLFVGLGLAILAIMVFLASLFLLSHWPFLPVLKWILIGFTVLLIGLQIQWRLM